MVEIDDVEHAALLVNQYVHAPNLLVEARGLAESSAEALQQYLIDPAARWVIVLEKVVSESLVGVELVCISACDFAVRNRLSDLRSDEVADRINLIHLLIVPNICLD